MWSGKWERSQSCIRNTFIRRSQDSCKFVVKINSPSLLILQIEERSSNTSLPR